MLIRDFYNVQEQHRPSAVSIGNFDGVHLGHVRLLGLLKEKAQTLGAKATAMIACASLAGRRRHSHPCENAAKACQ